MKWNKIKWKPIEQYIFKLQKKIYQASKNNRKLEMYRLQRILLSSQAAKLKAVRRVTQDNRGKKTAGVDGIKLISPEKRFELVNFLVLNGWIVCYLKLY